MTRVATGEVNGDYRTDVVLLAGGVPVWVISPGIYEAMLDFPEPALDVDILPQGAPDGRDAAVLSNGLGLRRAWIDLASFDTALDTLGTAAWIDAPLVRSADLAGAGSAGVLGIDATRTSLLMLPDPGSAASETSLTFDPAVTIFDAGCIEWDGTPGDEIVLLTSGGIRVINPDGSVLYAALSGDDSDVTAAISQAGTPTQRLVSLVQLQDQMHYMACHDPAAIDPAVFTGALDPVAAVGADYDLDGRDELLVSHRATGELLFFRNQSGDGAGAAAYGWQAGNYQNIDLTEDGSGYVPAPENAATPAFADLDGDGDADILFPIQKEGVLALSRSRSAEHSDLVPAPNGAVLKFDSTLNEGELYVRLHAPVSPPPGANGVQVVVWRQTSHDRLTNPVPVHHSVQPWTPGSGVIVTVPWTDPIGSDPLLSIEVRMVELSAHSEVVAAGPSISYTTSTNASAVTTTATQHDVSPATILWFQIQEVPSPQEAPASDDEATWLLGGGGGSVPLPCVPCFVDEELPQTPPSGNPGGGNP